MLRRNNLIGKFCKQKCLLLSVSSVPIKFTSCGPAAVTGKNAAVAVKPAQRPDVTFPLFARVPVLPTKFHPDGPAHST